MTISNLVFDFTGQNQARYRNDITVDMNADAMPGVERFEMATDEGAWMGGDDTAPPPLAHFVTGLAGCLMTQLRLMAKRLDIELGAISVNGRVTWQADSQPDGTYIGGPGGVQLDVELDTPVGADEQRRLLDVATRACFVEQTILNGDVIKHTLVVGDQRIAVD